VHYCGPINTRWTPIGECSLDLRIRALPFLPQLREKVVETAEESLAMLNKVIGDHESTVK